MFSIAVVGGVYFGQETVPRAVHNPGLPHLRKFALTRLSDVISRFVPQRSFMHTEILQPWPAPPSPALPNEVFRRPCDW